MHTYDGMVEYRILVFLSISEPDFHPTSTKMVKMAPFAAVRARGRFGALSAARASTNTSALGTMPITVPGKRVEDALGRPTHAPFRAIFAAQRFPAAPAATASSENDAQKERASAGLVRLLRASRAP